MYRKNRLPVNAARLVACGFIASASLACSDVLQPTSAPPLLAVTGSTITDLETLGGSESRAYGINDSAVVVGYSTTATGAVRAFRWSQTGGMVNLGTLPGDGDSYAFAVNNNRYVAGVALNSAGQPRAVRWNEDGNIADLGTLGGSESYGFGVNADNQIAGYSTTAQGATRAFRWRQSAGMTNLGTPPGGTASFGHDITSTGTVVGAWTASTGETRAFSWTQAGGFVDLGLILGANGGHALAVNDSNHVVGFNHFASLNYVRAFRWRPTGVSELNVGLTVPGTQSAAFAINGKGQIAGYRSYLDIATATYRYEAFVWTSDAGGASVAMLPGGTECYAHGINSNGQVAGMCANAAGELRAVLWNVTYQ